MQHNMTKQEQFNQEERSIMKAMDIADSKRNANDTNIMEQLVNLGNKNTLLKLENKKLIEALRGCKDYLSTKYPKEASILHDLDKLLK